jgi:hypothetical protein
VLANCGALGLNWERIGLSDYFEALEAHNDTHDSGGKGRGGDASAADLDRLRRFSKARGSVH